MLESSTTIIHVGRKVTGQLVDRVLLARSHIGVLQARYTLVHIAPATEESFEIRPNWKMSTVRVLRDEIVSGRIA